MKTKKNRLLYVSLTLLAITLLTVVSVTVIQRLSADRIETQRQQARLASLHELLPTGSTDWELITQNIQAPGQFQTDTPVILYQAIDNNTVQAIVIAFTTHDGYNGDIELLAGFDNAGQLLGVRTGAHIETPGIGDAIDIANNDWISQFSYVDISEYQEKDWEWRRHGGQFDQLTGATITANAVLRATNRAAEYYQQQHENTFIINETTSTRE